MVGTIAPVVYGDTGRSRWRVAMSLHVLGSIIGSGLFGAALGGLGWLLRTTLPMLTVLGHIALGLLSGAYGLHEIRLVQLVYPQVHRQVDGRQRYRRHPYLVAWRYGFELGIGLTTFIATASVYIITFGALLSGDPLYAAALLGCFGLARAGFLTVVVRGITSLEQSHRLAQRMSFLCQQVYVVNGIALVFTGTLLVVIAWNAM